MNNNEMEAAAAEIEAKHPRHLATPEYLDELDQIDPLVCSRARLVELYRSAEHPEVRAFLVGILDTRTMIALVAGLEF